MSKSSPNSIKTHDFLRLVAQDAGFTIGDVKLIYKSMTKIIYLSLLNKKILYLNNLAKIFVYKYTRQLYNFHIKAKEEKECIKTKMVPSKNYKKKIIKNSNWDNDDEIDSDEINESEFEE
jgi:hypothetical protein